MKYLLALSVALFGCLMAGCDAGKPEPLPDAATTAPVSVQANTAVAAPTDSAEEVRIVQADVRSLLNAVHTGDIDTLIRYTHPKILVMLGGESNARTALKEAMAKTREVGISLESLAFPAEPTFLRGDKHEFVIVPTKSIMTAMGQRVESLDYLFGAREIGTAKWTYVEGSRINSGNVRSLFPDFPSDFAFPLCHQKEL